MNILKNKSEGGIEVVIATLIAVLLIGGTMVYFISNMVPLNTTYKAETVVRKYMLKEEQDGYLTQGNVSSMESELQEVGAKNISVSGSTLSQVDYGKDVYLDVSYTTSVKKLVMDGIVPSFSDEQKTVTIQKSSTSKKAIEP